MLLYAERLDYSETAIVHIEMVYIVQSMNRYFHSIREVLNHEALVTRA